MVFFLAFYKRDTVYIGVGAANDDDNYIRYGKKQYLFTVLAEAFILLGFLAYFISVIQQYVSLMNEPHEERERQEALEKKKRDDEARAEAAKAAAER